MSHMNVYTIIDGNEWHASCDLGTNATADDVYAHDCLSQVDACIWFYEWHVSKFMYTYLILSLCIDNMYALMRLCTCLNHDQLHWMRHCCISSTVYMSSMQWSLHTKMYRQQYVSALCMVSSACCIKHVSTCTWSTHLIGTIHVDIRHAYTCTIQHIIWHTCMCICALQDGCRTCNEWSKSQCQVSEWCYKCHQMLLHKAWWRLHHGLCLWNTICLGHQVMFIIWLSKSCIYQVSCQHDQFHDTCQERYHCKQCHISMNNICERPCQNLMWLVQVWCQQPAQIGNLRNQMCT